ncbi:contact-dependent growth inhibition system immunity protein [Streptomyces sp. NPDC007904]|uniref:contact-dependent growth inhibition system immunity protein n=1 Tax=Streptomyces sp. NPDC007904 TaxID=3364787 RepID=UPI0036ED2709
MPDAPADAARRIEHPVPGLPPLPQNKWEYRERFPELNQFLGGYFHQDFFEEYTSYKEAVDDYVAEASDDDLNQLARDISALLTAAAADGGLERATSILGMDVSPPPGSGIRQWLGDVAGIVSRRAEE